MLPTHTYLALTLLALPFAPLRAADTPLHTAAKEGDIDQCTQWLINGVHINAKGSRQNTALHYATMQGRIDICILLLKNGASVNEKNTIGWTPLHYAACQGQTEICTLLLKNGANVNEKNNYGEMPLHIAASWCCKDTCALLLKHGASVTAKNNYGKTPLDRAKDSPTRHVIYKAMLAREEKLYQMIHKVSLLEERHKVLGNEVQNLQCGLKVTLFAIVVYTLWLGYSYLHIDPKKDL